MAATHRLQLSPPLPCTEGWWRADDSEVIAADGGDMNYCAMKRVVNFQPSLCSPKLFWKVLEGFVSEGLAGDVQSGPSTLPFPPHDPLPPPLDNVRVSCLPGHVNF